MRSFTLTAVLLSAAFALSPVGAIAPVPALAPVPAAVPLATMPLVIRAGKHVWRFRVEVARTDGQQERGLMFRKAIGAFGGMLFPFDPPRPASFWMRNTLVPLDMVFVRSDGSIARIAAMTKPLSLDEVQVGEPVSAVLELKGGRAAALGITEAAHVSWRGGPPA